MWAKINLIRLNSWSQLDGLGGCQPTLPGHAEALIIQIGQPLLPLAGQGRVGAGAPRENHQRPRRVSGSGKTGAGGSDDLRATDRLQLRFLQTMMKISSEHNTTTILPIPIDPFAPFIKRSESRTPKEP
jgi:hypothetical protein